MTLMNDINLVLSFQQLIFDDTLYWFTVEFQKFWFNLICVFRVLNMYIQYLNAYIFKCTHIEIFIIKLKQRQNFIEN